MSVVIISLIVIGAFWGGVLGPTPISRTTKIRFRPATLSPSEQCDLLQLWGSDQRFYVAKETILTNAEMLTAAQYSDSNGEYSLGIRFTSNGAEKLSKSTGDPEFPLIAIVVDDILMFAGPIISPIKDRAIISGGLSQKEVAAIHFMLTTNMPDPRSTP